MSDIYYQDIRFKINRVIVALINLTIADIKTIVNGRFDEDVETAIKTEIDGLIEVYKTKDYRKAFNKLSYPYLLKYYEKICQLAEALELGMQGGIHVNKVAIVGYDRNWGAIKSFWEAASKETGYEILSGTGLPFNSWEIRGIGGYKAVDSGAEAIALLKDAGSETPLTDIFFSTHGVPYAIGFNNSGNNLYTSEEDMKDLAKAIAEKDPTKDATWTAGKDAAFISDFKDLVEDGFIAEDVTIKLGGCRNAASSFNVLEGAENFSKEWALQNEGKDLPDNFARLLSIALPLATIIASSEGVDSGVGIVAQFKVIYKNGGEVVE